MSLLETTPQGNAGDVPILQPPPVSPKMAEMTIDRPHESHIRRVSNASLPSAEQLAETHQHVTLKNIGKREIMQQDRYNAGHLMQPGDVKELDLGASAITRLQELARENRGIYTHGPKERIGQPFEKYPIIIINMGDRHESEQSDLAARKADSDRADAELKLSEAAADRKDRELKLAEKQAEIADREAAVATKNAHRGKS